MYFVFESCPNGDLGDLIGARGKLDMRLVKLYAAQLVDTLAYLQGLEIMHRDLKPQNLMLDHRWNLKMVSFCSFIFLICGPFIHEMMYLW